MVYVFTDNDVVMGIILTGGLSKVAQRHLRETFLADNSYQFETIEDAQRNFGSLEEDMGRWSSTKTKSIGE